MKTRVMLPLVLVASAQVSLAQQAQRPATQPKADPAPAPVEVRTWVSRTALWVGDRITYVVELRCPPDVEVLTDDLDPERLRLAGLEVLDTAAERDASGPDEVIHRMRYSLVSYATDLSEVSIAPVPVRYATDPAAASGAVIPAGEVLVPELKLALRSTIPINDLSLGLRDRRPLQPLPVRARVAPAVGLALIVLAIAPAALWAADVGRRAYGARMRRRSRPSVKQRRAAFEELKALDTSAPDARRQAFDRLDALVREHLQASSGVAAVALTPSELGAIPTRGRRPVPGAQVERVLAECELAKYAPELPAQDRWRAVLDDAEDIITA